MYAIIKTTIHMFKHIHFTDICKRKSIVNSELNTLFIYPTPFSPRSRLLIVQTTISCALPCQLRISNQ